MKLKVAAAILLGSLALVRADDTIANAQQALKDQGFYYGDISGNKDADTTAAIRRYQIRNGLRVSGELDKETLDALISGGPPPVESTARSSPPPHRETSDEPTRQNEIDREQPDQPSHSYERGSQDSAINPPPPQPFFDRPQDQQPYSPESVAPPTRGLFAGTPYEMAPPEVQRNIVSSAQELLARRDLYRGEIDGIFGPGTEFSLRAYQARLGLPVTGRFDLETLAGLDLLPGRRPPFFSPRREVVRPFPGEPVRGEWIRDY
jgi:peptidoglycan hydrolase-like protein with peptidoglycan-binding domain